MLTKDRLQATRKQSIDYWNNHLTLTQQKLPIKNYCEEDFNIQEDQLKIQKKAVNKSQLVKNLKSKFKNYM